MTTRPNNQGRSYGKSHPDWPVIEFTQDYRRGQVFFRKRQWVSMTPDLATIFCAAGVAKVLGDVFGEVEKLSFSQCEVAYPGMLRKLGLSRRSEHPLEGLFVKDHHAPVKHDFQCHPERSYSAARSAYTHEDYEAGIQPHESGTADDRIPDEQVNVIRKLLRADQVHTMCVVCGSQMKPGEKVQGVIGLQQHAEVSVCIEFLKGALEELASRRASEVNGWQYKIFSHEHLDGVCVERGCQSLILENAIRNQCGDNLCWITDPAQAKALPEAEFIESCRRYRNQIADELGEFSEGRTIAQLEALVLKYRKALEFYADPRHWSGLSVPLGRNFIAEKALEC